MSGISVSLPIGILHVHPQLDHSRAFPPGHRRGDPRGHLVGSGQQAMSR
jgi:hypothetical protein